MRNTNRLYANTKICFDPPEVQARFHASANWCQNTRDTNHALHHFHHGLSKWNTRDFNRLNSILHFCCVRRLSSLINRFSRLAQFPRSNQK